MADPICRWRNSSIKQLIEFNSILPLYTLEKSQARDYVEKNWQLFGGNNFFTTPYQLAAQMGLYYEDELYFYPRFNKLININEAINYMLYWGRNYYAPNPYTKSIKQDKAVVINKFLVNWVKDKGRTASFSEALKIMFPSEIGNTDILINMLNNFSEVLITDDIVSLKDDSITKYSDSDVWLDVNQNDKEIFFEYVSKEQYSSHNTLGPNHPPLQQIFYGAPGTGKSHIVKKHTEGESVIRTTFHPDSDYSTFVGCYKPTTKHGPRYTSYGEKAVVIKDAEGKELTEDRIVYEFVDQAFLQSYIKAWNFYAEAEEGVAPNKQFLIIEEINRGNCAQIFGDLFQLLDRNDYGFSDYYIHADRDMQKHLAKAFNGIAMNDSHKNTINAMYHNGERDIVAQVLNGEILLLPNNLYIWATMNTSDQSLFPIDSAFKRRWDWKYRPIVKGRDKDGNELNWRIKADTKEYDWWSFLEKINAIVGTTTNSEDKKLGFFFCKPTDSVISAETFVSKVVFYLWNDVFKNFGFDDPIFKDEDGSTLEFDKFYTTDIYGDTIVRTDKVERFLENLKVKVAGEIITEIEDEDGNTSSTSTRDYTKYSINGIGKYGKNRLAQECIKEYIKQNPTMSAEEVLANWKTLGNIVPHFIESFEDYNLRTDNSKRSAELECGGTVLYVANDGYGSNGKADVLMRAINQQDWGIRIEVIG